MVGGVAVVTDRRDGGRARVRRICRGGVVLERLMMRNVVGLLGVGDGGGGASSASRRPVGISDSEIEAALEEAPGDIRGAQRFADVRTAHLKLFARGRALIADGIRVADHGKSAEAVVDYRARAADIIDRSVGLSGDEVQRA